MIAFRLSMPSIGSYNSQWTGSDRTYVRVFRDSFIPKEYVGKSFYYRWKDGWEACITVEQVDKTTAAKLKRVSAGFYGYDWMIDSIINHGEIMTDKEFIESFGTDEQKFIFEVSNIINHTANEDFTKISGCYLNDSNMQKLIDKNILNESAEMYNGGPTVRDMITFMKKYSNVYYHIVADVTNRKFEFIKMTKGIFSKINTEATVELAQILKNVPTINTDSFNNIEYIFTER